MIIDSHSHIGSDYYFGDSNILNYDEFCKKSKINIGIIMPMPWPMYEHKNNLNASLIWEHNNYSKINYFKLSKNTNGFSKEIILENPYKLVNYNIFNLIKNTKTSTKILFAPLIHGKLDKPEYLEKLLIDMDPVAIKMHGFSGGFYPEDINGDIVDVLKYYDIPIITHTSVYKYNYGYGLDTKYWRNKCSPINWFNFFKENKLRGVLNHGACLDTQVLEKVNYTDNIMVGLGPVFDLSTDYLKMAIQKEKYFSSGYLNLLKKYLNAEKILFDVDYNWNVDSEGKLDFCSIERVRNTWNYIDSEKILFKNAKTFYTKLNKNN